nr:MAG TPA: protein of unknown function (DUF4528) [Caudoviricetes sp.]
MTILRITCFPFIDYVILLFIIVVNIYFNNLHNNVFFL